MKQITLFTAMAIFFYLVVSFLKMDINAINWTENARFVLCMFWAGSAFINVFWYLNPRVEIK